MQVEFGRVYLLTSSHITVEEVTPWDDGTFDVVREFGTPLRRASLDDVDAAAPEVAYLIRINLLADTHAACDFPWQVHPSGNGYQRIGRCPTCGEW